jgi:hypothetical protein
MNSWCSQSGLAVAIRRIKSRTCEDTAGRPTSCCDSFVPTPKEQLDNYFRIITPLDAINYVPHAAPIPLLFQFARFEQYFNEAAMKQYAGAASEPKLVLWYDTGHALNDVRPLIDLANWLRKYIGMKPVAPILRSSLLN